MSCWLMSTIRLGSRNMSLMICSLEHESYKVGDLPTEEGGYEEREHPVIIYGEPEVQAVHVVVLLGRGHGEGQRGLG